MLRLQQILADAKSGRTPASRSGETTEAHLASVPLDRIAHLTSELQQRLDHDIDEVDALAMQLLLTDYAAAVAHLRAVARVAEQHVEKAAAPVDEARRFMRRQLKIHSRHGTP
jgi:hypothetical protein